VTLDDFMALNDELAALVRAGVPVSVDFATSSANAEIILQKINAHIARQVSHGLSIEQALAESPAIPPSYRGLMLLALQSHDFHAALSASHRDAEAVVETRRVLGMSLVYPAIVIGFAYAGLMSMCLFLVPVLERLYQDMQLPAGMGLRILTFLRMSLPYWIALPPLALLIFLAVRLLARPASAYQAVGVMRWLPGMRKALFLDACAIFADSLAALVESGVPLPDSLVVAAEASRNPVLVARAADLALEMRQGTANSESNAVARQFPPFLRWALLHGGERTNQARALRAAARIYRESAQRRVERLRVIAPLLACVLIGGGVTLLYGLALFLPLVELLRGLA
jgi:type II secretory pathway component PulF